ARAWRITQATCCNRGTHKQKACHSLAGFFYCEPNQRIIVPIHQAIAAAKADAGIVKIQAQTMLPATPQRTADILRDAPTPTMAPVIVCVVETGTPSAVARNSVKAPPVSAQKPPTGF